MKKYIAIIIGLLIVGCDLPADQKPSNNLDDLYYWRDSRTNICFASFHGVTHPDFSFTIVPCDSAVTKLIK